jgi:hypothetical protein
MNSKVMTSVKEAGGPKKGIKYFFNFYMQRNIPYTWFKLKMQKNQISTHLTQVPTTLLLQAYSVVLPIEVRAQLPRLIDSTQLESIRQQNLRRQIKLSHLSASCRS